MKVVAWQNTGDPLWIKVGSTPPDKENWIPLVREDEAVDFDNRRLRLQLEQEWTTVMALKAQYRECGMSWDGKNIYGNKESLDAVRHWIQEANRVAPLLVELDRLKKESTAARMEAAIAWEVCASVHRTYGKGRDALFTTRQDDYVRAAEKAREKLK